ncbi:YVTN beta-propeller repeat-containing protein [Alicycliphilus sp. B1]|nr:YVTN beta-propeller repeat-containing protein [Alicycliphilus sp. B1]
MGTASTPCIVRALSMGPRGAGYAEGSSGVEKWTMGRMAGVLVAACLALGAQAAEPPVFVLNSLQADIQCHRPGDVGRETARIATGKEPHHLYLTPDEKSLIVANALGDSLTFVDPGHGAGGNARCAASSIPTTCGSRPTCSGW